MKFIITTIFVFVIHSYSFSQIVGFQKKDTTLQFINFENSPNKKIVFGFNYENIVFDYKNPVTFERTWGIVNTFEPHLGYYLKQINNLGFGLNGKIEYFSSNFATNNTPNIYELGVFTRYFLPLNFNVKVFNRLSFSAIASFSKTNYSRRDKNIYYFGTDTTYTMFDGLSQSLIRIGLTWQFRIYKGLNFKMSYRYEMFLGKYYKYRPTVGLEYHFYYDEKKKNKRDF